MNTINSKHLGALLLLIILMLFSTASADETTIIASGTCGGSGDNVRWSLDNNGLLTISGNGPMLRYGYRWGSYKSRITSVIVEEGVTTIGDEAFYRHSNLNSISLPTTLTSISSYTFDGCTNLQSVYIPTLDSWLQFKRSHKYSNPTYYGATLYVDNVPLTHLTIPNTYTELNNCVFAGCSSLISVSLPENMTTIGEDAFLECSNLAEVHLPNKLEYVGTGAFYSCNNLKDVYVPSLEGWLSFSHLGYGMTPTCNGSNLFIGDTLLTRLVIPDNMTEIADRAFHGCESINEVVLPDGVVSIGYVAFEGCTNLATIFLPDGLKFIDSAAFVDCPNQKSVYIPTIEGWLSFTRAGWTSNPTVYGGDLYIGGNLATHITIPDNITEIPSDCFTGCTSITSVVLHDKVTSIGDYAFEDCTALQEISLPESLTSIGNLTFYNCQRLATVHLPSKISSIGIRAFDSCVNLKTISLPNALTSIGNNAFDGCSSLTSVIIPGKNAPNYSLASIPAAFTIYCRKDSAVEMWAKENNYSIVYLEDLDAFSIILPAGVTHIADEAFANSSATAVILPSTCKTIGSRTFADCDILVSIYMPDSVTGIADDAFEDSDNVTFICESENTAAAYAEEHNIPYSIE